MLVLCFLKEILKQETNILIKQKEFFFSRTNTTATKTSAFRLVSPDQPEFTLPTHTNLCLNFKATNVSPAGYNRGSDVKDRQVSGFIWCLLILVSGTEYMMNKIDHYKIHENQESRVRSLSSLRAMLLLFFSHTWRKRIYTRLWPRLEKRANLHSCHKGRKSDHINVNKVGLTEKTVNWETWVSSRWSPVSGRRWQGCRGLIHNRLYILSIYILLLYKYILKET